MVKKSRARDAFAASFNRLSEELGVESTNGFVHNTPSYTS